MFPMFYLVRILLDWCKVDMCKIDFSIKEYIWRRNPILIDENDLLKNKCITMAQTFQTVCLNKNVLKTALSTWNNFYQDYNNLENDNLRCIAYNQFIARTYGLLGKKKRKPLPTCVMITIRQTYPDLRRIYIPYSDC